MKRKLITFILMTALTVSLLAGCGNSAATTETEAEITQESETQTKTAEAESETEEETCAHEWAEATYDAPETCTICGETRGEPLKTYVEENGLTFSTELSGTIQGYQYNYDDISDYEFVDVDWKIAGITIEDAEEDGYRTVTVEQVSSGYMWGTYVGDTWYSRRLNVPGLSICDLYTGIIVPQGDTEGDTVIEYGTEIKIGDVAYTVGYTLSVSWEYGDWIQGSDGTYTLLATVYATYAITIPEGYDGLALCMAPDTEPPEEKEYGVIDDSETEYIMDLWGDGSYLWRVSDLYELLGTESVEE